jgi:hypothetical protein
MDSSRWCAVFSRSPAISAARWRPGSEHAPDHRDLSHMITIVRDHLPQHAFQGSRDFLVALMHGLDLALHLLRR